MSQVYFPKINNFVSIELILKHVISPEFNFYLFVLEVIDNESKYILYKLEKI